MRRVALTALLQFIAESDLTILKRPKYDFPIADIRMILQYLWCKDDQIYISERFRVQLAFILQILLYGAGRPGALVESGCHYNSNEVIAYKVTTTPIAYTVNSDTRRISISESFSGKTVLPS